jgi:hypothetical protein
MPKFEVQTPKGKFEINAPDEASAIKALDAEIAAIDRADQIEKVQGNSGAGSLFRNAFSFGLEDKAAGAVGAVQGLFNGEGLSAGFEKGRRAQEIIEGRARERAGTGGKVAEVAGSIASGAVAKAPQALSVLGRIGQGIKEGVYFGGLTGLGESDARNVQDLGGDVVVGAGVGGAAGGVMSGALEAGRGAVKGARSVVGAAKRANMPAGKKAADQVLNNLQRDGVTPELAAARMSRRGTSLINAADENIIGLGRTAGTTQGEGKKLISAALDAQQRGSKQAVLDAAKETLGDTGAGFHATLKAKIQGRSSEAQKLYGQAFKQGLPSRTIPQLKEIMPKIPSEALTVAKKIAKADGREMGKLLVASTDDAGELVFTRMPDLQEWHYIQRGLRAAKESAYKNSGGELGTVYKGLHDNLKSILKTSNPTYRKAMETYADDSAMIEAIQRGRGILSAKSVKDFDLIADEVADMSLGERDMFRAGLARSIFDEVNGSPSQAGDVINKLFRNDAKRGAIRAAFSDDKSFRAFEVEMKRIAKNLKSFKEIRTGSRTAPMQAERADGSAMADAFNAATDVATGNAGNAAITGVSSLLRSMGGMDEATAAQVAKILIQENPTEMLRMLSPARQAQMGAAELDALLTKAFTVARGLRGGASAETSGLIVGAR